MILSNLVDDTETEQSTDYELKTRLTTLLRQCGLPKNSHVNFLSQITGLSYSGARKILEENRLPKNKQALSGLLNGLSKEIGVSKEDIRRFLLVGENIPEKNKANYQKQAANQQYSIFSNKEFEKEDPVYISKIILKIEQVCDALCVEEVDDISSEDMDRIRYQVLLYCHKNRTNVDSPKLTSIITGLIELAKENIN